MKNTKSVKTSQVAFIRPVSDWNIAALDFSNACYAMGKDPTLMLIQAASCLREQLKSDELSLSLIGELHNSQSRVIREEDRCFYWITPDEVL